MSAYEKLGLAQLIVLVPTLVLGVVWYILRRNVQPIKAREPWMLIVVAQALLAIVVMGSIALMVGEDSYYTEPGVCLLSGFFLPLPVILSTIPTFGRLWMLFFRFGLAGDFMAYANEAEKLRNNEETSMEPIKEGWFLRKRNWGRPKRIHMAVWIVVTIMLSPVIIIAIKRIAQSECDEADNTFVETFAVWLVVVMVLVTFLLALRVRNTFDGYFIKKEFKWSSIYVLAISMILFLCWALDDRTTKFEFVVAYISIMSGILGNLVLYIPIALSYKGHDTVDVIEHGSDDLSTLPRLLTVPAGVDSFKTFLKGEFSVENLLLWEDTTRFIAAVQEEQENIGSQPVLEDEEATRVQEDEAEQRLIVLNEWACEIYHRFISPIAPLQINLPCGIADPLHKWCRGHDVRRGSQTYKGWRAQSASHVLKQSKSDREAAAPSESVTVNVTQVPRLDLVKLEDLFMPAQGCILKLMATDSWRRYCKSEGYLQLKNQALELERKSRAIKAVAPSLEASRATSHPGSPNRSRTGSRVGSRIGSGQSVAMATLVRATSTGTPNGSPRRKKHAMRGAFPNVPTSTPTSLGSGSRFDFIQGHPSSDEESSEI